MWTRPALGVFRFGLAVEHIRRTSSMDDINLYSTEFDVVGTTAIGF